MAVNRNKLFDSITNGAAWDAGVVFNRTNGIPIDKYSVFETYEAASDYALNNPVAYPGQYIAVVSEDGTVQAYIISTDGSLDEFGGKDGTDNQAPSENAHAEGYNTFAGGKGFTITAVADNGDGTGDYTLSSVTGLEVGMKYSAVLSSANYNAGTITAINANIVTVDGYTHIELNDKVDDPENFNVYNCFLIIDRPDLGDKEVGFNAHAEGENTIASNKAAHAEGANTKAIGKFAHAEGNGTIAGHGAHAEGGSTQALGDLSHSEGNRTKATGNYSHTEGNNTVASAQGTHAEGIKAQAIYNAAHAEGQNTLANGLAAHAEGESTVAKFTGSHAEGVSTQAIEEAAHAEGYNAQATAKASHAEGENTVASAKRAHAEGYSTTASELNAHAEGKLTTASAEEAHAEGISTIASGAYSHAEGNTTQALSEAAHAEGKETIAQGIGAHAEGSKSKATNNMAHAEGSNTEASGEKSHAEGNSTKATGTASHAEGDKTEAKGYASHAGGQSSIASNAGSFVHGTGLKTNSNNQAVVGAYNKTYDSQYAAFIVGNGKEDARSNALAVMKSGDTYVKGDLYVGGTPEGDEGTGIVKVATEDETHLYAETAANNAAERVKNELLNGAGDAYDTLKELGDLIEENKDAFEVVTDLVNNKADQNTVANAYKKTVSSGSANLTITDHSPVPHMMKLASESKTSVSEVEQYNKNLLDMTPFLGGALVQKEDGLYDLRYSNGNTYVSAWNRQKLVYLNDRVTISLEIVEHVDVSDGNLKLQIQTEGGNHWVDFPVDVVGRQSKTITAKGNVTQMQFLLASSNGQTAGIIFKDVQLEFGNTATDYIPYQKASYIVDNTGIDVPALYPITYFVFKSNPFTCTYNQDINHMLDNVMSTTNPKGTGSFSMNRQAHTTVGENSVAVGYNTEASGQYSFAEGLYTEAAGRSSHAEGNSTKALDYSAHAGGYCSIAKETGSFAHGEWVTADADYQTTFGTYNEVNTNAAFIVGNGEGVYGHHANAFEVNYDGNAYVQQSLFVGGTGANQSSAKEVATKNDVEAAKTDIKNDLLNGAGEAYDTLKELGVLIDENNDAIEALKTVATNKADKSNTVVTGSFSMGRKAGTTVGNNSFAVGTDVTASGTNSSAEGKDTTASGMHSHAEGHISQATGYGAHAENGQTKAIGGYSHAEGYLSEAQGDNSHSEGMKTKAIGNNSHASGQETKAEGTNSVAAGHATQAIGDNSFATGAETKASSPDTFVAGLLAKAGGKAFQVSSRIDMPSQDGFAVGGYVVNSMTGLQALFDEAAAQGQMLYYIAHIEATDYYEMGNIVDITSMPNTIIGAGIGVVTPKSDAEKAVIPSVGNYLMIMGCPELGDIDVGLAAFAEGIDTRAQHRGAHVEGISAIAAGPGAHGEGILTRAVHFGSHAEGFSTIAGGAYSHAGGYASEAGADHAFAHGEKLYAYGKNQFVVGQYNKIDNEALFIVGGGDSEENRKNLFVIKKDGSIVGLNTSNALTKTVSGEVIRVDDASPIEHEMNVKVRNKNLIPTPYGTSSGDYVIGQAYTKSGVDFTMNEDGSVTLNGTATANIFFSLATPSLALPDGSYTLSGGYKDANNNRVAMCVRDPSDTIMASGSGPATFSTQTKGNIAKEFYLYAYSGSTFDNVTLYPQLEEGITATAYTPYIEDISTVKVKKLGKNIIPFPYSSNTPSVDGVQITINENGTITYNGTPTKNNQYDLLKEPIVLKEDAILSGCPEGGNSTNSYAIQAVCVDLTGTAKYPTDIGQGAAIKKGWTVERIFIQIRAGVEFNSLTFAPQLEYGTSASEYEPYNIFAEYPVSAEGTVEGVTSIYPATTLVTDTSGAIINCTYNRDINRVLDDTGFMYDHNPVGTGSFSMNRKVGSEVGDYSFTEGYSATAAGKYSHAGGEASQAKSDGSFAHGQRVTADADYQATFGTYNEVNANAALIVGNGANSTSKNNAFEVQKNGNAFVKGNLYVGGTGSTQASAKQVATRDSVTTMEQRVNNLENITSSMGGVFFEDADVAYVKTIPENVASYASLNKVGGLGIYKKKLANLIPSTYETANGTVSGYHTFNSNADGVITIVDRTPVEEWTSEPWFNAEISLNTIELPAGTYTAAIYADNPEGSPFGLSIYSGEEIRVGGAWGWEYAENPVTFALTETTSLNIALKFDCGGSVWVPTGDVEVCHFRVMLNEGDEAMPWEPYSESPPTYVEPPKVTSIDIIGKNVLDYGEPRIIQDGNANTEGEVYFEIRDNGTLYIRDMRIPVPMGPDSIYGTSITATIPLDADTIYPAGTYSMGASVEADGLLYLTARAKSLDGTQSIMIQGSNNIISTPFTIQLLELTYEPSYDSYSMPSVEIPLVLVRGAVSPVGVIPSKRSHIVIPETLLSRGDYGIGAYDTRSGTLYTNSIDFDNKKYLKNCLIYELYSQSFFLDLHESKINTTIAVNTIQCSDPKIAVDVYENSDTDPNRRLVEIYAYSADPDNPIDNIEDYLTNNPVKVLFGTNLTEEIDISAELAGIDNYISIEAGGLIIFNNDQQADIPSTIEYQSMMKEGETE